MGGLAQVARRPTMKQVAKAADVSVYTVSRAINGQSGVGPQTRERVRRVAAELGFVPDATARNLKRRTSTAVGVLTANGTNRYYSTLVGALDSVIQRDGYHSVVADAVVDRAYSPRREDAFVATLVEQRVAAAIFTYSISAANVALLERWRIPVMFVDCLPPPGHEHLPCLTADNHAGSRAAGEHCAAHGHRRWAWVGFTPSYTTRRPREQGFVDAAAAHGATVDVIEGGNDPDRAHAAVEAYLAASATPPDVFYAGNTPLLQGTLRALRERGLSAPDDVALIAFDDFDWAPLLSPPVTVVDQHIAQLGTRAGEALVERFRRARDEGCEPVDVASGPFAMVRPTLVVRESCGCPPTRSPEGRPAA